MELKFQKHGCPRSNNTAADRYQGGPPREQFSRLNDKDRNPPINNSLREDRNAPINTNQGASNNTAADRYQGGPPREQFSRLNDKDRNPPINNSLREDRNAPINTNQGATYTVTHSVDIIA